MGEDPALPLPDTTVARPHLGTRKTVRDPGPPRRRRANVGNTDPTAARKTVRDPGPPRRPVR